jgi:hypothetical protein
MKKAASRNTPSSSLSRIFITSLSVTLVTAVTARKQSLIQGRAHSRRWSPA